MPPELEAQLATGPLRVGLEERLENAQRVLANLESYGWPGDWPPKPGMALFDDELVDAWRVIQEGGKPTREQREDLKLFLTWRQSVYALESKLAGALQLLVATVNVLELSKWDDQAAQVRAFILDRYGCKLPEPCPHAFTDWVREYANRFAQNRTLLPLHLRKMTKAPKARRDATEQGEMSYGEG